jgi:hypothetical protein
MLGVLGEILGELLVDVLRNGRRFRDELGEVRTRCARRRTGRRVG